MKILLVRAIGKVDAEVLLTMAAVEKITVVGIVEEELGLRRVLLLTVVMGRFR